MDFSNLPYTAFLRIFEHLPLEHCLRVGRVSKSFRQMSLLVASRTKSLDLTEDRFRKLAPYQLRILLDLCSKNLKRIKIPDTDGYGTMCALILARYQRPRLVDLDLDYVPIENDVFRQLIRNNRRLESVRWRLDVCFVDPNARIKYVDFPAVITENLRKLTLSPCNDNTLRALTNRCPNLEYLDLITKAVTIDVFEQFIASIPKIQEIKVHLVDNQIAFENLISIWNCPLTSLNIAYSNGTVFANDEVFHKISTRLPRLKKLSFSFIQATNEGISSLGHMQHLESLYLYLPTDDFDEGIRCLAHCGRLQELMMDLTLLSSFTLITLLRSCPQLRLVTIRGVEGVECGEEAALVLKGLSGMPKRDVIIGFHGLDDDEEEYLKLIWETEPVAQVITELKEEGIKLQFGWVERQCRTDDLPMEWEMEEEDMDDDEEEMDMENVENDEDI